jgi:hypothetical protein
MAMAHPRHDFVAQRAGRVCEYCRIPESLYRAVFVSDHIIARQHGGSDSDDNLAYACLRCNQHKGPNIAGLDPESGQLTRLFNPRADVWYEHFQWSGHTLVGRTPIGRTTIRVLAMNAPIIRAVRAALLAEGTFPLNPQSIG